MIRTTIIQVADLLALGFGWLRVRVGRIFGVVFSSALVVLIETDCTYVDWIPCLAGH
jgi:hypothetical protein